MNKKGFTLVEILATITILAILMIAAIPSMNNLLKKSKEEHDENIINTAIMASKSYFQDNKKYAPKYIGAKSYISLKDLKDKNYLKEDIYDSAKNTCMKESYVTVFKKDTKDYVYSAHLDCAGRTLESEETTKPSVSIYLRDKNGKEYKSNNASHEMSITKVRVTMFGGENNSGTCNSNLQDGPALAGYSIFIYQYTNIEKNEYVEIYNSGSLRANGKKCLTAEIDLSKYIDITQENKLKIVARANNEFGNESVESFDAKFDDKEPPQCIIISQAEENKWTNDKERTVIVGCDDNGGSGCKQETYTKTFDQDMSKGNVTIEDVRGNKRDCVVNVNLDRIPPKCTNISKEVNKNGNNYTSGTWRNVNIYTAATCSETGDVSGCTSTKKLTTSGVTGTLKKQVSKDNEYTVDKVGESTTQWFVYDKAGNEGACDAVNEKIDKTAPTCTVTGGSKSWTNASRTITATCHDEGGSGCKTASFSHKYDSEMKIDNAGANGTNKGGKVYDNAGNEATCSKNQKVRIDKTKPTCTVTGGNNNWTNSSRTITATCHDEGGSGCATASISHTYNKKINTTKAGANGNDKGGKFKDNAGNEVICPKNQTVRIDKTAPTMSWSPDGGTHDNNNGITVTISCSDKGGSDINVGGTSVNIGSPSQNRVLTHTCTDNAGNSVTQSKAFNVRKYSSNSACGTYTKEENCKPYDCSIMLCTWCRTASGPEARTCEANCPDNDRVKTHRTCYHKCTNTYNKSCWHY